MPYNKFNFFLFTFQVFPVEVPVFLREHKNGMYRADTYFLAKTFSEVNSRYALTSYLSHISLCDSPGNVVQFQSLFGPARRDWNWTMGNVEKMYFN